MCTTWSVIDQAQVKNKGCLRVHLSFLTVKSVSIENVVLTLVEVNMTGQDLLQRL